MPRRTPSAIADFVRRFLATETASGVLCVVAIAVAMVWANSPWHRSYESFWSTQLVHSVGGLKLPSSLAMWIGEGAMTVFFFVIGLEVKRELVVGELRVWRAAALPVIAAIGGMVTPAVLYLVLSVGTGTSRGWAIPMATDLAVALGVVALLGDRVTQSLKIFLLTLAVVDDIGAVVAIAVVFTRHVELRALVVALGIVLLVAALAARGLASSPVLIVLGVAAWVATVQSGVHPTVAGVALAFALPVNARTERLEERLHPVAAVVIVPAFVLAEAGVHVADASLASGSGGRVAFAVATALVVGKAVGVTGSAWLAVKLRVGQLPSATSWGQMAGLGVVCGMGLTVALLVADLAFHVSDLQAAGKLGVLIGSIAAGIAGVTALALAGPTRHGPAT